MKDWINSVFFSRRTARLLADRKQTQSHPLKVKIKFLLPFFGIFLPLVAQAQSITPADDGTGTLVTPNGNRFDISGGKTSADGANLFHNFSQFNLTQDQIANFLSTPAIQNILGRVTGGNISVINGLIQVTGGNSNLFLINPAGIVFGANALLNVPADFTAVTATNIGFGENWFHTVGENNYAALVGNPTTFTFGTSGGSQNVSPGVILNAGQLAVGTGQNLTLLGGTVVSTGQLSAPEGQITVAAVPGESLVRINSGGSPLSLEISPWSVGAKDAGNQLGLASASAGQVTVTPLSLPQLLTNPAVGSATGLTLNSDGTVQLIGSGLNITAGDVVVQEATAKDGVLSAGGNLQLVGSQLRMTRDLQLMSQDTVLVRDDSAKPFLAKVGGNLLVQGVEGIDIQALNPSQTPLQAGGNFSLISDGKIFIDGHFSSGKNFSILNLAGQPGNFNSLNDPIITVSENFTAGSYSGAALKVEAAGDINFNGDITITRADSTLAAAPTGTDEFLLGNFPALILRAGNKITVSGDIDTASAPALDGGPVILSSFGDILTRDINTGANFSGGNGGDISLSSEGGAINTGNLSSNAVSGRGGNITLNAGGDIQTAEILTRSLNSDGGNVSLNSSGFLNDIEISSIDAQGGSGGRGGNVDVTTARFFRATDTFTDQNNLEASISTAGGLGGGAITLRNGGDLRQVSFKVGNATTNGTAGTITSGDSTVSPLLSLNGNQTFGNIQIDTAYVDQLEPQDEPNSPPQTTISSAEIDAYLAEREEGFTNQFTQYLGLQIAANPPKSLADAREALGKIEVLTGTKPALMYISFVPQSESSREGEKGKNSLCPISDVQCSNQNLGFRIENPKEQLELVVITSQGTAIYKRVTGVSRAQVLKVAEQFRREVIKPKRTNTYLNASQQLYQWLVAPVDAELQVRGIKNLVFLLDSGLRSIPLAALHDGQKFLVERYSVGLMPSLTLSNTEHRSLKKAQVLAMGASKFPDQKPLPAVPVELSMITPRLWLGKSFLNQLFTLQNLNTQRRLQPFRIVHLATHAEFQSGDPSKSYVQLWDTKLSLDQLKQLNWNDPPVDLLVLSACRTALGDEEAELGFGGLAVESGVKSALASLWYVSDEGTLALMTKFYAELKKAPIRAEALRQAQIAMLRGQARIEGGELRSSVAVVPLPPELAQLENRNLAHPYYWAAFTMIGNPW